MPQRAVVLLGPSKAEALGLAVAVYVPPWSN